MFTDIFQMGRSGYSLVRPRQLPVASRLPLSHSASRVCSADLGSMFFGSSRPKRPRSRAASPSPPKRQKEACSTPAPCPPRQNSLPVLSCSECGLAGGKMNVKPPLTSAALRMISHVVLCLQCSPKSRGLLQRAHAPAVLRHVPSAVVDVPPPLHTRAKAAVDHALHRLYCSGNAWR